MKRVFVAGLGAVSPAGWTAAALKAALRANQPLPDQTLSRPGWESPRTRCARGWCPILPCALGFLAHPRLRRSSPVTHYAAAAALEAMAPLQAKWPDAGRLGIIACLQTGCVQYSCRFYDETLKDPATASPLVFPETVYAAPTSHVAALLPNVVIAYSLVGDASAFLQGVALAAGWLGENRVDACLVLGAEETNWIIADAFRLLDRTAIIAAGAGALCLCTDAALSLGVDWRPLRMSTRLCPPKIPRRRRKPCAVNWARRPPASYSWTAGATVRAPMPPNRPPGAIGRGRHQSQGHSGRRPDGGRRVAMRHGLRRRGHRGFCRGQRQSGRRPAACHRRAICPGLRGPDDKLREMVAIVAVIAREQAVGKLLRERGVNGRHHRESGGDRPPHFSPAATARARAIYQTGPPPTFSTHS